MDSSASSSRHHKHRDRDHHSKKRHHADDDDESKRSSHKSSKKHRHSDDRESKHSHRSHSKRSGAGDEKKGLTVVDDAEDEDMWVEKDITVGGERVLATDIPTSDSLKLKSNLNDPSTTSIPLPVPAPTESKLKRDDWMMLDPSTLSLPSPSSSNPPSRPLVVHPDNEPSLTEDYGDAEEKRILGGGVDFFSSLGTERKKNRPEKPDPSKLVISSMELNVQLKEGKSLDEYAAPTPPPKVVFGGPGSQWRMKKLQRVYETAEEDGLSVDEVARDRYDTEADFEEAKAERAFIDEREARRHAGSGGAGGPGGGRAPLPSGRNMDSQSSSGGGGEKRWMFTDVGNPESRPSSRTSFRRPGDSTPSTPQPGGGGRSSAPSTPDPSGSGPRGTSRVEALRARPSFGTPTGASSPVPSAIAPIPINRKSTNNANTNHKRALSPSSLNKLQARVLKAKLMGTPDAAELEKSFDEERRRAAEAAANGDNGADGGGGDRVEMVPTIDAQGRLYDVGAGKNEPSADLRPGNRRKKDPYVETRDKAGNVIRLNADDDSMTLGDMLRHERSGAGMEDQRNLDAELARAITTDGKFEDDLEYMDDNAEKLGRKKMRTDAMKRQFAINDFAKSKKVMAACQFCYGENDEPPKAPIIAMGTRAYLSCTLTEELIDGHCLIVPIQHHFCMLEADDDVWDEVRNFMKCLIKMAADSGRGFIFFETVINLKWQKHTAIECIPVPLNEFDELPGYFRESILASEAEWSQHKKLIDFSARPGGFRRAMVKNLPYFMVQWDYKGEKGYGHVIEGVGESAAAGEEGEGNVDEGDRGGGEFPRWFAAEIIGNVLDIEARRWRRPRKIDVRQNATRVERYRKAYAKYDWTGMIRSS